MPKTYVVVNRHRVQANMRNGTKDPTLRVARGKNGRPKYAHRVVIDGPSEFISNPDGSPVLPCGARIALVTEAPVRVFQAL